MFFSTWETYHTHTLYLGYINGPTEGLAIGSLMMAAAGYYGPQLYSLPLANCFGHPELFGESSFLDIWVGLMLGGLLVGHLPACVYNVVKARQRQGLPVLPVFLEWTQILIFSASCIAWLGSPYSSLLSDGRLVLFAVTMSFVFGRMTTKIILAHLTKQPFPACTVLVTPLAGGAVLANLPRLGLPAVSTNLELWYLRAYLVFAFTGYMHWALFVINRITTFLGINCLTIKKRIPYQFPVKETTDGLNRIVTVDPRMKLN
jgi:ethanolaminephosphotransferase